MYFLSSLCWRWRQGEPVFSVNRAFDHKHSSDLPVSRCLQCLQWKRCLWSRLAAGCFFIFSEMEPTGSDEDMAKTPTAVKEVLGVVKTLRSSFRKATERTPLSSGKRSKVKRDSTDGTCPPPSPSECWSCSVKSMAVQHFRPYFNPESILHLVLV